MDTKDIATTEGSVTDPTGSAALRREVMTGPDSHVDVVTVPPGGEIGRETHQGADETIVVVTGTGEAELDGQRTPIRAGSLLFIPDGTPHNILNRGHRPLRLYAVHAATSAATS
ncbi:MAG: cupin domain-containing protein [Nitriliruptor sp.]|nr:MAG: cupin domain-containing protein [Nitriliruptor sp.]